MAIKLDKVPKLVEAVKEYIDAREVWMSRVFGINYILEQDRDEWAVRKAYDNIKQALQEVEGE